MKQKPWEEDELGWMKLPVQEKIHRWVEFKGWENPEKAERRLARSHLFKCTNPTCDEWWYYEPAKYFSARGMRCRRCDTELEPPPARPPLTLGEIAALILLVGLAGFSLYVLVPPAVTFIAFGVVPWMYEALSSHAELIFAIVVAILISRLITFLIWVILVGLSGPSGGGKT